MATDLSWASTPVLMDGWTAYYDDVMGWGFKAENVNGKIAFLMPHKKYL